MESVSRNRPEEAIFKALPTMNLVYRYQFRLTEKEKKSAPWVKLMRLGRFREGISVVVTGR